MQTTLKKLSEWMFPGKAPIRRRPALAVELLESRDLPSAPSVLEGLQISPAPEMVPPVPAPAPGAVLVTTQVDVSIAMGSSIHRIICTEYPPKPTISAGTPSTNVKVLVVEVVPMQVGPAPTKPANSNEYEWAPPTNQTLTPEEQRSVEIARRGQEAIFNGGTGLLRNRFGLNGQNYLPYDLAMASNSVSEFAAAPSARAAVSVGSSLAEVARDLPVGRISVIVTTAITTLPPGSIALPVQGVVTVASALFSSGGLTAPALAYGAEVGMFVETYTRAAAPAIGVGVEAAIRYADTAISLYDAVAYSIDLSANRLGSFFRRNDLGEMLIDEFLVPQSCDDDFRPEYAFGSGGW